MIKFEDIEITKESIWFSDNWSQVYSCHFNYKDLIIDGYFYKDFSRFTSNKRIKKTIKEPLVQKVGEYLECRENKKIELNEKKKSYKGIKFYESTVN